MFKHILVPTDFTDKAKKALDIAVSMAAQVKGKVSLLHVIEIIEQAEYAELKDFYDRLMTVAQKEMDSLGDRYDGKKTRIHKEILLGKRVYEILRFAQEQEVDLIVLSSHRIDKNNPAGGWGTISYKVAILSDCPVMMVK